ncbi:MAG: hypothetical protein AAGI08_18295 [Bacteroidota bacterium]
MPPTDTERDILLYLYGEGPKPDLYAPGARDAYEDLADLKDLLDERPASQPSQAALTSIFEAAEAATPALQHRPAVPPARRLRLARRVGLAAALAVCGGVGYWLAASGGEEPAYVAQEEVLPAELPAWDAGDDLRAMHLRAAELQGGMMDWEEAVPLESIPLDEAGGEVPLQAGMEW